MLPSLLALVPGVPLKATFPELVFPAEEVLAEPLLLLPPLAAPPRPPPTALLLKTVTPPSLVEADVAASGFEICDTTAPSVSAAAAVTSPVILVAVAEKEEEKEDGVVFGEERPIPTCCCRRPPPRLLTIFVFLRLPAGSASGVTEVEGGFELKIDVTVAVRAGSGALIPLLATTADSAAASAVEELPPSTGRSRVTALVEFGPAIRSVGCCC